MDHPGRTVNECREPPIVYRDGTEAGQSDTSGERMLLVAQSMNVLLNQFESTYSRHAELILISDVDILHSHLQVIDNLRDE